MKILNALESRIGELVHDIQKAHPTEREQITSLGKMLVFNRRLYYNVSGGKEFLGLPTNDAENNQNYTTLF